MNTNESRKAMGDQGHRSPRRVLFLNHTVHVSGAEISLLHLVRALADGRDWEPVVAAAESGAFSRLFEEGGLQVEHIALRPPSHSIADMLSNALELNRFLSRHNIGLVHANSFHVAKAIYAFTLTSRIPVVVSVRDIMSFTWLTARALSACNAVACVSKATAENLLRAFPAGRRNRVHVIYNGVPLERFQEASKETDVLGMSIDERCKVITCFSPLVRWKGQDVLLQAAQSLLPRFQCLHIVLVGHDEFADHQFLEDLHWLAHSASLQDRVHFLGFRENIPRILAASDIVVVPSIRPDPFPRVVIEAMAAGRPVVASDCGGIPEAIEDGVSGRLVPPGDPEALAAALSTLLENPRLAQRLGERAAHDVRRRFAMDRHVEAMVRLYNDVTSGVKRRCSSAPVR